MDSLSAEQPIPQVRGFHVLRPSVTQQDGALYFLIESDAGQRQLVVSAPHNSPLLNGFTGEFQGIDSTGLLLCPLTAENAAQLRQHLSWLNPSLHGLAKAAGFGDRLGLATPGHVQAVRAVGGSFAVFPAQQSIREMTRTGRTPQQVFDAATWGLLAEGWRFGFGADADHLKTTADIDRCLAAGYTFYTFDPIEHVIHLAEDVSATDLQAQLEELPWSDLEDSPSDFLARYTETPLHFEGHSVEFDAITRVRAAVSYGKAVAQAVKMYRHLAQAGAGKQWEIEIAVDETGIPTTHAEHVYIVKELQRLGVPFVSFAPCYVGKFEKGIDYIGSVADFEADIAVHAAIARSLGPYKLSLHSGSDKFSIYEAAARQTQGMIHLKTAGTSYLEALRTLSRVKPDLLLDIYAFARESYARDRASYHVSARLDRAPEPASLSSADLPTLLDQDDSRQILHVTFGSVLTGHKADGAWLFYDRIMQTLQTHPDDYAADLRAHFVRHLRPFAG